MAYTLSASRSSVNEGSSVTITLNTDPLANGTLVPYVIYGSSVDTSDFVGRTSLTGNFNVVNNTASFNLNIAADTRTEGSETVYVSLTGSGRTETTSFIILDSSTEPLGELPTFSISSVPVAVFEDEYVTVFVKGRNVFPRGSEPSILEIPYNILGASAADILNDAVTGNIILYFNNQDFTYSGNIQLGIREDFVREGQETFVFLLRPSFPALTEILNSIIVLDRSEISPVPSISVRVDKLRVFEGGNVLVNVDTYNIPNNTVLTWKIVPWENSDISISDFVGISNLTGSFPPVRAPDGPLQNGSANITLFISDDFIFEPSEYFYVVVSWDDPTDLDPTDGINRLATGTSQIVEIIDSGNTLLISEETYLGQVDVRFLDKAVLEPILGGYTVGKGDWINSSGKLSDTIYIQGKKSFTGNPDAYYQPFSYVIKSNKSIEEWRDSIRNLLHPAGMVLFGEFVNESRPDEVQETVISAGIQSSIQDFYTISVDRTNLTTDATIYTNSRFSIILKSDFTYYIHRNL